MKEKKFILLMVLFVLVFQYRFIYIPAQSRIDYLDNAIAQKNEDIQLLQRLADDYKSKQLTAEESAVKISSKDFSAFNYIGDLVEELNLKSRVRGINPLPPVVKEDFITERIKISMENVTISQVYEFLSKIELSDEPLYIPEYRMNRQRERQSFLNVEMEISVFKRAQ